MNLFPFLCFSFKLQLFYINKNLFGNEQLLKIVYESYISLAAKPPIASKASQRWPTRYDVIALSETKRKALYISVATVERGRRTL